MMDLFLTNTQLFTSQDINWWTGVLWITCGLLWCFYQLFGLLFWRHPFTAEDPLVSKWCNATFLQTWWRNKLIYILDCLRLSKYSANLHFGGNYFFIMWRPLQEFPINLFYSLSKYLLDWSGLRSTHLIFTASTHVMNLSLCAGVDVGVGFDHCLVFQDSSSVWFRAPWISVAGAGDFAPRLCFWDIAELWQRCPKPHRF